MTQENTNYGRDQNIINQPGTVIIHGREKPVRPRNELLLLQFVRQEVESRLEQSLHNAVLINLGKQAQPDQVKRPWDAEVKIGAKEPQPLPSGTSILDVFTRKDIAGSLLILGNPGSGKTTTMLDLAQALVSNAEQDITQPIPVLLNLASWKDPRLTISDWLVAELKSKYGVRKDIASQWLADKQLLPLLDGLDEVKPEHQESCVNALNQWLQSDSRPTALLVCSRQEEYANYDTALHLNGAILLQNLIDEQIQACLTAANQPGLWQILRQDAELWDLIGTPLWLSITILSYEGFSLTQWEQTDSTEQRLSLLLDAYIERMLHRKLNNQMNEKRGYFSAKRTRQWLTYLAQQLHRESQTEFLIERMQPSWLTNDALKRSYTCIVDIFLLPIHFSSPIQSVGQVSALTERLNNKIQPIEALTWSWENLKLGLLIGALFGGVADIFQAGSYGIYALLFGIIYMLVLGLNGSEIEEKVIPNQGIRKSALNAGVIICIYGPIVGIIYMFISHLILSYSNLLANGLSSNLLFLILSIEGLNGLVLGLIFGIIIGLSYGGGTACVQHLILRILLFRSGSIPWNYARFLNYCTERLLLQRVGGRYRFIHKLLQDHFAAMPLERK